MSIYIKRLFRETSLKIKNFKRVTDEIELLGFDQVNYFVGPNGSGKTSILNALTYLNDGSNSKHFFTKESVVEFQVNGKKQAIRWNDQDPNRTSHIGGLSFKTIVLEEAVPEKGANGILKLKFNYESIGKEQLDYINETSSLIGLDPIRAERIINNDDPWDNSVGTRIFKQDDKTLNILFLSQGLKAINNLRFVISEAFRYIPKEDVARLDGLFIVIEEPENNLHPDLHKQIPRFLDKLLTSFDLSISNKVYFFVSTHSPFLVSAAAKYEDQKIYLLKDGALSDLQLNKVNSSKGFKGKECAWVVGQMLGADVTDLGYPENYCILEEYSLQIILEKAKENNLIRNIQFVSAAGAMRVLDYSELINEIDNINTLVKCNPYYFDKYIIIMDKIRELNPTQVGRLLRIKNRLTDRFIELSEVSLEEYYKNLDPEIYKSAIFEISKLRGRDKGAAKANLADSVSCEIKTSNDFSLLFNHELDFLLK